MSVILENLGLSLLLSLFSGYLLDHVQLTLLLFTPSFLPLCPSLFASDIFFPKMYPNSSVRFPQVSPPSPNFCLSLSVLSLAACLPVCLSGTRSILLSLGRPVHRHVWSCCHFLAVSLCVRLVPCSFFQFGIFRQGFPA